MFYILNSKKLLYIKWWHIIIFFFFQITIFVVNFTFVSEKNISIRVAGQIGPKQNWPKSNRPQANEPQVKSAPDQIIVLLCFFI